MAMALAAPPLAGCGDRSRTAGGGAPDAEAEAAAMLANGVDPSELAGLRSRVQTALSGLVPSPMTARYANLRNGSAGAACGEVELVPGAPLHPFVVTADGVATVNTSAEIHLENPDDPFPDLYMQYCASVEELQRLGDRLENVSTVAIPAPVDVPPTPVPQADDGPPDELPVDEPPAPAPRNDRRAPAGDDDSFFNAVVRAPQ